MKRIAKFLESQGCSHVNIDGDTVWFYTPAGEIGSVTRHRGGGMTEYIGNEQYDHRDMASLRRAWKEGAMV